MKPHYDRIYGKGKWRIVDQELQLQGTAPNSTVKYWFLAPKNIYSLNKSKT